MAKKGYYTGGESDLVGSSPHARAVHHLMQAHYHLTYSKQGNAADPHKKGSMKGRASGKLGDLEREAAGILAAAHRLKKSGAGNKSTNVAKGG